MGERCAGPDKGFLPALDDWYMSVAKPRLVVVDVVQRVKPPGKPGRNSYENDYQTMEGLRRWASDRRLAVVCLHHTRKGGADDPLEALSGSNGLSACADTTLLLDRDQNGVTLYVRGARRRGEGKGDDVRRLVECYRRGLDCSPLRERGNILAALENAGGPMSPSEIADVTGMKNDNIRRLLFSMLNAPGRHGNAGVASMSLPARTSRTLYREPLVTTVTN
jgi:hypothetical protein